MSVLSQRPSTTRLALILGTLSAFGPLSIDMYLPGLPAMARTFGADPASAQLTLSLFFVGLALGQSVYGPLADRFGRRWPLLIGCALYAVASCACALAPSMEVLIALRFVQAVGGCAGMVLARSVVRDLFNAQDSARMFSLLMLVMGLAPITAPLIGGQILLFFGWQAIFWLLGGFGLLCVALVWWGLPESLPPERRSSAGLGQALAVYGRLLADRSFMGYGLTGGLGMAGMFAYIAGSPFVFIELYGVAPQQYGWLFGLNALGLIAASQLNRWLLARTSAGAVLTVGAAVHAAAAVTLALVAALGLGGMVGLLVPLFVCIASLGLVSPNATAAAMAPHGASAGSASALLGTIQFGAGAITGALVGAIHGASAFPMASVIAICGLASFLSLTLTTNRRVSQRA
jgi:DHA1 family bicyclomycin/chloramphenicol resistance-like MFS transporter